MTNANIIVTCDPKTMRRSLQEREIASNHLPAAAVAILQQGLELLQCVPRELYARKVPVALNASLGAHYRHCLDHFRSFLRGAPDGTIDYDDRDRDPRLEQDPTAGRDRTVELIEALKALAPSALNSSVRVRGKVGYGPGESPFTRSSMGRELTYVIAHTIHHYALISVMARILGIPIHDSFGVAPSTLAYQASQRLKQA